MPIVLYINTLSQQYYFQIKGLIKVSVRSHNEALIEVRIKLLFFSFSVYPFRKKSTSRRSKKTKQSKSRKSPSFSTILRLLKSFKLKKIRLEIDTGNYVTNAKLYPVMAFLNYKVGDFNVNFEDRNLLVLHIENRPINIIRAFINI